MRENFAGQGVAHACYHNEFQHLETFDEAPGTVQGPGVRADAQCCKIDILTWLEELVSQSNTIQAQEDITEQGRLQASGRGAGMVPPSLRDLQHCASVLGGS